jgi:peptide/nickel transport system substrate-binding protein
MTRFRALAALTAAAVLALGVNACGDDDDGGDGGGAGGTIIQGTIDQPVSYDPAGSYDLPSWNIIWNTYQNLLVIPPGGNTPEPEAAERCEFTNPTTYSCTLKQGLVFSDGSPLTSEDVKFSFDRNVKIASPTGASSLLANMQSVSAPDPKTVAFKLKAPDATWPFVLTIAATAIVPSDSYPADKLQPSDQVIGSGRYTVADFKEGQQTVLEANPEYKGSAPPENDRVIVQYFDKGSTLKLAVEQGDVDIAYRQLSPTDVEDLRGADGIEVIEGEGTEIRYLVFNLKLQEGNEQQKLATRQAFAYLVDRNSIAQDVYNGTVEPLYSMVPAGLQFHKELFADMYGESPDPDKATQMLQQAGVQTPVSIDLWYTPSHYGPATGDEAAELKRQLEGNGLFKVTLKSSEWNQYDEAALTDKYPYFHFGWFPDYPDADNYTYSFYSKDSFLNIGYSNPEMEKLLAQERASTDDATRAKAFDRIQTIGAEEVPTLPLWQGKQIAVVRDGVTGVEETLDPAFIFRYWLISKD